MLPTSGPISIRAIFTELTGNAPISGEPINMEGLSIGTYADLNPNSPVQPDTDPKNSLRMSSWYGYDQSAGVVTSYSFGGENSVQGFRDPGSACLYGPEGWDRILFNNTNLSIGQTLYEDLGLNIPFNGGGTWWWNAELNRSFLIGSDGVILGESNC
jgi:hypothetical protein